uniref:7TM_GPCR_Srx domain-containing protein n=1 Tax=Enterobius vermicularis TaxID=51028 RepID=A0A0N4V751_ENTVE
LLTYFFVSILVSLSLYSFISFFSFISSVIYVSSYYYYFIFCIGTFVLVYDNFPHYQNYYQKFYRRSHTLSTMKEAHNTNDLNIFDLYVIFSFECLLPHHLIYSFVLFNITYLVLL